MCLGLTVCFCFLLFLGVWSCWGGRRVVLWDFIGCRSLVFWISVFRGTGDMVFICLGSFLVYGRFLVYDGFVYRGGSEVEILFSGSGLVGV